MKKLINKQTSLLLYPILLTGLSMTFLSSCQTNMSSKKEFEYQGIEYFSYDSEYGLTYYLLFDDTSTIQNGLDWRFSSNVAYRFIHKELNGLILESALLTDSYSEEEYRFIVNGFHFYQGFEENVSFSYKSFTFVLNTTYSLKLEYYENRLGHSWKFKNYFESDDKYFSFINLVGFSDTNNTIAYLGLLYYDKTKENELDRYYHFTDWSTLFVDYFNFYNWN